MKTGSGSIFVRFFQGRWLWFVMFVISFLFVLRPFSHLYASTNTERHIKFGHISREQGLSQSRVSCIVQDRQGFMWFGTANGLNKYDGYEFTVYRNDPENPHSLSDNDIQALYKDRNGGIWIGTYNGGLNYYDRPIEHFIGYEHDSENPFSLSDNEVKSIYEDQTGFLWVGTANGLNKFDRTTGQFQRFYHNPDDPDSLSHSSILSLSEDRSGRLWIGTEKGLNYYDQTTSRVHRYARDPDNPHSLSHIGIYSIYEDRSGTLWIGTSNGVNQIDQDTKRFRSYHYETDNPHSLSHNAIYSMYEDRSRGLWFGTYAGLNRYDQRTDRFSRYHHDPDNPHSLSDDTIWALYEDHSGVLWIGTEKGLNTYDLETKPFRHYQADPQDIRSVSDNYVSAIYEDHAGVLWVGTDAGLDKRVQAQGTEYFLHYRHNPDDPHSVSSDEVTSIYEDRFGALWIGTFGSGLNRFDRETEQFRHYRHNPDDPQSLSSDYILSLYEDRSGTLWIGTEGGGLNAYDRAAERFQHYQHHPDDSHSLSNDNVIALYEDQSGIFWVGTDGGGLNQFNRSTGQFVHYEEISDNQNSLSGVSAWSIYENREGILWIGTEKGLNKLVLSKVEGFDRKSGVFTHYRQKHGLLNDVIFGIVEDEHENLWLSTEVGLSKFNPQTEVFRNYDVSDGLQIEFNQGAYHKSQGGEMFFGGIQGFNTFHPETIQDNSYLPRIVITDVQLFNKSVELGKDSLLQKAIGDTAALTLSYKDYVVSFEFAALHYAVPEKNRYAYIMEGFEKDWNYITAKRRFATYTNLPAGTYTFRVKGSNNDGVWNEDGVSRAITVTPPPWKTWWAYTLYVLLVISMFLAYIRYKQMQYQREREILDRFVPYEFLNFLNKKSILNVQLGDHISKEMGIMFSDIRSFTTLAETMTPQENFDFVNAYLKRVSPVITAHGGFTVKFIGDAVMAVFPNGAEDGVRASIEKLRKLREYNEHRQQDGWQPIRIGIGLHVGHMMIGMVGEKARMQGDALSDNVNLTSRLEGLTKYYGVSLLISGYTLEMLPNPDHYHIRFLDQVQVKGKENAIKIYEVFDADPEELIELKLISKADFEAGQQHYFALEFSETIACFQKVLQINPDDKTAQLYLDRSEEFLRKGVPEGWNGIERRTSK